MASTTRLLLDRLADALQRKHAAQAATSTGPTTGQTVQLTTPTVNLRRWLRRAWPRIKFALGFLFVTIGAGSSVIGFRADMRPLMERLIVDGFLPAGWPALALGLALGVLAALVIFWGEVLSAEHERWHWYLLFLVPDVRYTYRMFGYVIDAFGGGLVATGVGFVGAIVVAHFGEQWIFGTRRKGWIKRLLLFQWGRV